MVALAKQIREAMNVKAGVTDTDVSDFFDDDRGGGRDRGGGGGWWRATQQSATTGEQCNASSTDHCDYDSASLFSW
jgi:hypothetical protein